MTLYFGYIVSVPRPGAFQTTCGKKFPNCRVFYTDTDRLSYEIRDIDILWWYHTNLDTSDYPVDNDYNMVPKVNKKILRMMKDENNGRTAELCPILSACIKRYTQLNYTTAELERKRSKLKGKEKTEVERWLMNKEVTIKNKSVKKSVIENNITFDEYVQDIFSQNLFQLRKHEIHTVK